MGYAQSTYDRAGSAHAVPFSHFVAPMRIAGEAIYMVGSAVARPLIRAIRAVHTRYRERTAFEVLSSLDDRTLRDIGISPSNIRHVAKSVANNPDVDHRMIGRDVVS